MFQRITTSFQKKTPEFGEVATKIPTSPFPPRNTCNAQRSELGPRPRWNFTVETDRKRWRFRNATFQNPHGVMGWVELVGLGWLFWLVGLGWCWVEVGWVGWLGWLICLVGWVGWLFWLDWLGLQALKRRYPLKSYCGPLKERIVSQNSIFQGRTVSFGEG